MSEERAEEIFFLGAGASVAAGVPDTFGLVEAFKQTVEIDEKRTLDDILHVLGDWRTSHHDSKGVDVELLLETMERLANLDQEVLAKFLRLPESKSLDPVGVGILSAKLKNFIRKKGEVTPDRVAYLAPLFSFKSVDRPLSIFSVNYDIGIEQLCSVNKKRYADGFDFEWNRKNLERTDVDIRLYKLHGSIMWYRTDTGSYVKIPVSSLTARTELITGETAETLILYPMRKMEYEEPLQELLMELKNKLEGIAKVIVVGYSFRDEHIRRVFWDAARQNRQFTLVLIGPHCRDVYLERLKHYDKQRMLLGQSPDEAYVSLPVESELAGRTICLPYQFEKVLPLLKNWFFPFMRLGATVENNRLNAQADGADVSDYRINELQYFLDCCHIDKVEETVDEVNLESLLEERPSEAIGICLRAMTTYASYGVASKCKEWQRRLESVFLTISLKLETFDKGTKLSFGFLTPKGKWVSVTDALLQNLDVLKRINKIKPIILETRYQANKKTFESIEATIAHLKTLAAVKDAHDYKLIRGKSHRNALRRFERANSRFGLSKDAATRRKAEEIAQEIEQDELAHILETISAAK